ncbi:hypothetical protein [Streptomyces sp. NPDC048111]|uniref:hypothetical protein n=1 Tax=Streptomyces sp. NPDC048111 TaxID=3365500 RepID=UPI00371C146A
MVLVAVLLPNLMLAVVLALGRYEEFMLGVDEGGAEPRRERHLFAVPDLPPVEEAADRDPRPSHASPAPARRHAA